MTRATRIFVAAIIAMTGLVAASNYLVQIPINDWWTWGAVTYPFAFLVTDLTNRTLGAGPARKMIAIGFFFAVIISYSFFDERTALASGSAFLVAQLIDVAIFNRLRTRSQGANWWVAPLVSSVIAASIDTAIFFPGAFLGSGEPWINWALTDYAVKMSMVALSLLPYRLLIARLKPVA